MTSLNQSSKTLKTGTPIKLPDNDDDFPCLKPHKQMPIRGIKIHPHHERWIAACYEDTQFSLAIGTVNRLSKIAYRQTIGPLPYSELWQALAAMRLERGKWWVAGWRTRYAMDKAGLLAALDAGEVKLPKSRSTRPNAGPGGKVNLSAAVIELDLLLGKNKIKVIDLHQLGIDAAKLMGAGEVVTLETAKETLAAYIQMCRVTGMSASRTTAAQTGYCKFRTSHIPNVLMCNLDSSSRELERKAYFNGRTECFRLGDIPYTCYSLDVRACYGSICLAANLPAFQLAYYPLGLETGAIDPGSDDHWIASCVVRTTEADYPLRREGSPIYPVGEFHTTLAWPELRHALQRSRVRKITCAAKYAARPVMRRHAEWYFHWRQRLPEIGLSHMLGAFKATFNASLGYTARQEYSWREWKPAGAPRWWLGIARAPDQSQEVVSARVLDGRGEWLSIQGEPMEAMPFLHATICSYGRVKLLEVMNYAGRENVVYCDTDGLLVSRKGWDNIHMQEGLVGADPGQLAERFAPGNTRIGGQKNYRIGNQYVCAGGVVTRQSLRAMATVLTTPTGRADTRGIVSPFEYECSDCGDTEARWINVEKGWVQDG